MSYQRFWFFFMEETNSEIMENEDERQTKENDSSKRGDSLKNMTKE